MKYTCKICGKEYDYCHSCSITKDIFRNHGYCNKNCYDISMLIQQYRGNALDVKDAMELLEVCDADKMTLVPGVAKYYEEIKEKSIPKVELMEILPDFSQNYNIEEPLIEEDTSSLKNEDTKLLDE